MKCKKKSALNSKQQAKPIIESISPDTVPAGLLNKHSIAKIKGKFNGGVGEVYLRTADDGGIDSVLIPNNLITWTDTLITVNIPSEVTVKPTPTTIKIVAIGSGYISIKEFT